MSSGDDAVLILGGGVMQGPAIQAARRLGFVTHVADGNASCPGAAEADHFYHVDLRDLAGLLQCAREIPRLRGVFTAGTDFSSSVSWLTEHLGLPGIPYEVSRAATDKGIMRERLSAAGLRVPRYRVVTVDCVSSEKIREIGDALRFPVVCKPVDNMGARGVRSVATPGDLETALREAIGLSVSHRAIIEEYITGDEYSLDALVFEGVVSVTGVARRHIFFPPWFVELGHTIPAHLSEQDRVALETAFTNAIRAIGITCGAAKGDIFLAHDPETGEPVVTVGEIAARLSGGYMSGWTYPASSGVPLTELGVHLAVGNRLDRSRLEPSRSAVAVERAVISAPGVVRSVQAPGHNGDDAVLRRDERVFVTCSAGDSVSVPTNNVEKVANIIAVGPSLADAEARVAEIRRHIAITLEPHNPITNRFVFEEGWHGPWAHYAVSPEMAEAIERRPMFRGEHETLHRLVAQGHPLPVHPLSETGTRNNVSIVARHLSVDGIESLEHLVDTGVIAWASASPHADGMFWKAFLSSGVQGVHYLVSCLMTSQEVLV